MAYRLAMPDKAIIFDLDDTLIVDEAVNREVLAEVARAARRFGADPERFPGQVHEVARRLWQAGPHHGLCRNIGISAYECLWGDFHGHSDEYHRLGDWACDYRVRVFETVLATEAGTDAKAASSLAEMFVAKRRTGQRLMPNALEVLTRFSRQYSLGLLTNGSPRFQRAKLEYSGLGKYFNTVVVSGEHGIGKPDPRIFKIVLDGLGAAPSTAVMVGNSLERDIQGARRAGVRSVWLRIPGAEEHADVAPDHAIDCLSELEKHLQKPQ